MVVSGPSLAIGHYVLLYPMYRILQASGASSAASLGARAIPAGAERFCRPKKLRRPVSASRITVNGCVASKFTTR